MVYLNLRGYNGGYGEVVTQPLPVNEAWRSSNTPKVRDDALSIARELRSHINGEPDDWMLEGMAKSLESFATKAMTWMPEAT
jgi:hypothetical protein